MKDLIDRMTESIAEVLAQGESGWEKVGSGFAITSDGQLATSVHVLNGASEWMVKFWGDAQHHPAKQVAQDADHDVAIIAVEHATRPLALGEFRQVEPGDDVVWAGYPLAVWVPSFHKGMISYQGELPLPRTTGPTESLQMDGTINSGNSGGPVVDPHDGRVVAIVSAGMGQLSESVMQHLQPERPTRGRATVRMLGVDVPSAIEALIHEMDRNLQLGVGYGISVRYLEALMNRTR